VACHRRAACGGGLAAGGTACDTQKVGRECGCVKRSWRQNIRGGGQLRCSLGEAYNPGRRGPGRAVFRPAPASLPIDHQANLPWRSCRRSTKRALPNGLI